MSDERRAIVSAENPEAALAVIARWIGARAADGGRLDTIGRTLGAAIGVLLLVPWALFADIRPTAVFDSARGPRLHLYLRTGVTLRDRLDARWR